MNGGLFGLYLEIASLMCGVGRDFLLPGRGGSINAKVAIGPPEIDDTVMELMIYVGVMKRDLPDLYVDEHRSTHADALVGGNFSGAKDF